MAYTLDTAKHEIWVGVSVSWGLILVLSGVVIYLLVKVHKLSKKKQRDDDDDDNESYDEESISPQIRDQPPYAAYDRQPSFDPQPVSNKMPYNPMQKYTVKRAKLMNSLRNKIEHNPRSELQDGSHEYMQPITDLGSHMNEDYPHPKNGTLKNGILDARARLSKKAPIPTPHEWNSNNYPPSRPVDNGRDRRSFAEGPPKDYPGLGRQTSNAQFTRRPFAGPSSMSGDNYPGRRPEPPQMNRNSRQEQPSGFLYGNRQIY